MDRAKIILFLKRALRRGAEQDACRFIKLVHTFDERNLVRKWQQEEISDNSDAGISQICQSIASAAEDDAQGLGGTQRYFLQYYVGINENYEERISFHVHGPSLDESDTEHATLSEGPSEKGRLSQNQRHLEAVFKTAIGAIHGNQMSQQQQLQEAYSALRDARAYIKQLEEQRLKNAEVYEELLSKKHERELEQMEKENTLKMKREMMARIAPVIPILINKVTGKNLLPEMAMMGGQATNPIVEGIKKWFENLQPEQFEKLRDILTDEQWNGVVAFYQDFQRQEAASSNGVAGIANALVPSPQMS